MPISMNAVLTKKKIEKSPQGFFLLNLNVKGLGMYYNFFWSMSTILVSARRLSNEK